MLREFSKHSTSRFNWLVRLFESVPARQFLLVAAAIVGLWAGVTAVVLKMAVYYLQGWLATTGQVHPFLYLIAPTAGITLTQLVVKLLLHGRLARGTAHVLEAMARRSSRLPVHETYSHVVTSALTVGMGGSAGLESPIVQTGAAIGSVFSSAFPIGYRERTLLLACGAAAGIAAAFNAPIAGVLIAIEVLLVDAGASSFIALLIAGAAGALTSHVLLYEDVLFSFHQIEAFNWKNIPFYFLLGLLCGLVSVIYKKLLPAFETRFVKMIPSQKGRIAAGGIGLGVLLLFFPALFGEGYSAVRALADAQPERLFTGSLLTPVLQLSPIILGVAVLFAGLIKPVAVGLTLGAGGNGGNFAPSLLAGSAVGFSFAWLFNMTGFFHLPTANFTLVAMAGVMAGIFHAPLSGIFLIAEITGGYDLMLPLMLVSATSTAISRYLMPASLDQAALEARKSDVQLTRDLYLLSDLRITDLVEKDFVPVRWHQPLSALIQAISKSNRNVFPVVDERERLKGLVFLEDVREVMFDTSLYSLVTVDEVMVPPPATIHPADAIPDVMQKFEKTGLWNLPVLQDGKYLGFISKSSMFEAYRSRLKEA